MRYALQTPLQLSSHLRALRKTQGLSQAQLGARLGLSQARIARIEGDPLSISVQQLLQVVSALGVQMTLEPLPSLPAQSKDTLSKAAPPVTPQGDW
jgi:HTH-type transcriptional regulator/antitoxin HipB